MNRMPCAVANVLFSVLLLLISPAASATCSPEKDLACWWTLSTCGLAGLGGSEKYRDCVSDLSNNWCTECVDAGPADPNCPVGSHMQGNVCVPYSQGALQISGPPGYSARSVAPNLDGRLELAAISSGLVSHLWQEQDAGSFVSASAPFPGSANAAAFPVMVQRLDGRLEVLVVSSAGLITRSRQLAPNVNWDAFSSISPRRFKASGLAAGVSPSGALVIAANDPDGTVWYAQESDGQWLPWKQAGTTRFSDPPFLANNADGRLELFAVATDGRLLHAWQQTQDGDFGGWVSIAPGPFRGVPTAIRNLDQRLEVFATMQNGALAHAWQVAPNGNWSSEAQTQGVHQFDPAAHINADGTLSVFVVGVNDHAVWVRRQLVPNGSWSGWMSLGGIVRSTPAIGRNADGTLQLFAIGQDGAVWTSSQQSPSSAGWRSWSRLGIRATQM